MVIGTDLVYVPEFARQLSMPGSRFESVFSAQELRVAGQKPDRAQHLAGRWAAKEACIKAWGQSRYGQPPLLEDAPSVWADIEVVPDAFGRVAYRFHGRVAEHLSQAKVALSISHDGDYAIAQCVLEMG